MPFYNTASEMPETRKTSKFNAAIFGLSRLHDLWKATAHLRHTGQLTKCNWLLDTAWLELCDGAKPEEKKEFLSFNKQIAKYKIKNFNIYKILMEKEEFLRKLGDKQGKSNAYVDESEDDFS